MDRKDFQQFKEESDAMLQSSLWLTNQMEELNDEAEFYLDNPELEDPDRMMTICEEMERMHKRSQWEAKEFNRFRKKYKRYLGDGF